MNRLLIGILDLLNKLLAILIIVSSMTSGYYGHFAAYFDPLYTGPGQRILDTVLGFFVGLVAAALVSGLLATLINISREATAIHQLLYARLTTLPPPPDRPL